MPKFSEQAQHWERLQENRPGGPGDPAMDDEREEEALAEAETDYETIMEGKDERRDD